MSNENLKAWTKEAFWVGFGLGVSVLALLVGTRFLTSLLSTEEYGKLALAISLATLAVQIAATPISLTAIRFYAHCRYDGKLAALLMSVTKSTGVALGFVIIVAFSLSLFSIRIEGFPRVSFILLVGAFASLLVINRVALALEDASRQRRIRALLQGGFEIGRFLLAVGLILLSAEKSAETALLGFVVVALIIVLSHAYFLRDYYVKYVSGRQGQNFVFDDSDTKAFRSFLLPMIISYASIWVVMMSERWMLQYFCNLRDVGGYAAVHQLAFMPMALISSFLLLLTTPILYQFIGTNSGTETTAQALKLNRYLALIILACTLIGFIALIYLHPMAGKFLLGPGFRPYSWLFPWLLFAGGCFAAAQQLLLKLTTNLRTFQLAVLWGSLAVIAVAAYMASAHYWQLQGLFVSVVGVNGLLLVFALTFSFRSQDN